jgi:acyl dehydratase
MTEHALPDLHRELEAMVGLQGPTLRGRITRRDIERFATSSGETTPIYTDEDAAREAGYDGVPSPPMLLSSVIEWGAGPPLDELRVDGTGVGRESWLPLEGLRLMGGGQDLVFHAPVLAETELVAQPSLESVQLKEGAGGLLVLMIITTEFRDADGLGLVTCRETLIAR